MSKPDFLQLDAGASEPLYRQIYTRFRNAIAEGLLQPGDRHRGRRWGAQLLERLGACAAQADCVKLVLDTGLTNGLAQRFYFREGLLPGALRFGKPIKEAA